MMDDQTDHEAPVEATQPVVSFEDVASETVPESVEREREITIADELDPTATEPYALTEGEDGAEDEDGADHDATGSDEPTEGSIESPTEGATPPDEPPPGGDQVVNAITAAVRR